MPTRKVCSQRVGKPKKGWCQGRQLAVKTTSQNKCDGSLIRLRSLPKRPLYPKRSHPPPPLPRVKKEQELRLKTEKMNQERWPQCQGQRISFKGNLSVIVIGKRNKRFLFWSLAEFSFQKIFFLFFWKRC